MKMTVEIGKGALLSDMIIGYTCIKEWLNTSAARGGPYYSNIRAKRDGILYESENKEYLTLVWGTRDHPRALVQKATTNRENQHVS